MTGKRLFLASALLIAVLTLAADFYMVRLHPAGSPSLFWARFFITVPALLFIAILYYLVRQQEVNSYLTTRQRYLEKLRQQEKENFEHIYQVWQESRRIRHDSRHMALLFKEYLHNGQYEEIKQILTNLQQKAGERL